MNMYEGDSYAVVDGTKLSAAVHPMEGVKQGCPFSLLLFSLFISDFDQTCLPHVLCR